MKDLYLQLPDGSSHPVRKARGSAERTRGLLGLERAPEWGLLLLGAPVIHTWGMRFPIDLLWIRFGRVVRIDREVPPGRIRVASCWRCLELAGGEAERLRIEAGFPVRLAGRPGGFS